MIGVSKVTELGASFENFESRCDGDMTAGAHIDQTVFQPHDLDEMTVLSRFLEQFTEQPATLLGPKGQLVPLPLEIYRVLLKVTRAMLEGKAIMVAPVDQKLTTQEAADFLGVSRPTMVKLLEQGKLPYERPAGGRHRRIRLQDLLNYQHDSRVQRRMILDELTHEAEAHGLNNASPEDYTEALRQARLASSGQ